MDRKSTGKYGEDLAAEYLRERGYKVLARNWRRKIGELDIVALNPSKSDIVFVEVKALAASGDRGLQPEDHVTARKQAKLRRVAEYFVAEKDLQGLPYQFDVIAVEGETVRHIVRAFS